MRIHGLLQVASPLATSDICHNAFGGSHIVNKIRMQMIETVAALPTKSHSIALCTLPGFKIRFNIAVTATLGIVNERIPNKKLTVLSRMAISRSFSFK
jgi:hypothetical protein